MSYCWLVLIACSHFGYVHGSIHVFHLRTTTMAIVEAHPHHAELPSPREYPKSDVLIFDGECLFCRRQVERIHRLDGRNRVSFISLHDPFVAEHYRDLTYEQMMEQMYVIDRTGRRHGGAAAFRYLTRRLPLLWLFAPLLHLPFSLPLWRWGYRQIAKRRYRWGKVQECASGTCEVHFK